MTLRKSTTLAALAFATALPAANAAVLLAHYEFEDASAGTNVADSAPGQAGDNFGTLQGGASFVAVTNKPATAAAGLNGQALSLNGTSGSNVNLTATSASILNGRTAFSYAAWVNINSFPATGAADIVFVSHSGGTGGGGRGVIQIQNSAGTIRSFARASTTEALTAVDEFSASPLTTGTWIHVASTYDIANNDILIYVNGVLASTNQTQTFAAGVIDNINSLYVGIGANNGGSGENLNGLVDDVRIYDGILTASEIQALAVVPEPATAALALPALALLSRRRR